MCLVSEHRELKKDLVDLRAARIVDWDIIDELRWKITQVQIPPPPVIEYIDTTRERVISEMRQLGVELMHQPMDIPYRYTTDDGWQTVHEYLVLAFPWPKYTRHFFDCENFAALWWTLVAAFFGLNYAVLTLGDIPAGYHGFNIYRRPGDIIPENFLCLEPQSLSFFEWGDRGYNPEKGLL